MTYFKVTARLILGGRKLSAHIHCVTLNKPAYMTRYCKYLSCKHTLEVSQYLEIPPFKKTCRKESADGMGSGGRGGVGWDNSGCFWRRGCPGCLPCLRSFEGSQEESCLSLTCRQAVDFQMNSQQQIYTLTPLEKKKKNRSNGLLTNENNKIKRFFFFFKEIERFASFQSSLGHYSWFGLETQRWKALHIIINSPDPSIPTLHHSLFVVVEFH